MKRKGNLFDQICCFGNIHLAYLKARKGKRYKKDILLFSCSLEKNLVLIKERLENQIYKHGLYKEFIVCDSKKRCIKAPLFIDRVMHHSLCNIIEPIFEKTFIFDSYACRKGKGTHKGIKRLKVFLKNKNNLYCLKCDISKYFDSINQDILIKIIEKKIKDEKVLWLIKEVLKSSFSFRAGTGIPIGNLTSQLFANVYLNELDQFVKRKLKIRCFIRYMDDFLILGKSKKKLHLINQEINIFLAEILNLEMNPEKINVLPAEAGIDFLGYIILKDYVLLRRSTIKRFLKKIKEKETEKKVNAWRAYAKHADSFGLLESLKWN